MYAAATPTDRGDRKGITAVFRLKGSPERRLTLKQFAPLDAKLVVSSQVLAEHDVTWKP
jgi:hypothetical protein